MFKIFYMVALDSFVTFSPNLSKMFGRGGGSVRWLCDILTNFSKFHSYWESKGSTCTWPFWESFINFPPPCLRGVAKYVSWVWWKIWQIRTDLGGGNVTYMRVGTKLLSKNITKQLFLFFCFLKEATLSFLTDAVDIFCLLLKNVDFIVFTSEVTKFHHIWKSFFSSISRVSFDRLINLFYVALNTENATHT